MTVQSIPIAEITVSSTDAQKARRKRFDQDALAELAESIKEQGVLQNIIVRQVPTKLVGGGSVGSHYELVAGERRLIAAGLAGLDEIPAAVLVLNDDQVVEIQLIENLQRQDVHPMEEAEGYQQLMKHGHPIEELHARVGKSRSYVYGRLKLLALSKAARKAFYEGEISASIALLVARIPSDELQDQALEWIEDDRMSYREAAQWVQQEFMLKLKDAPFPTGDAELVKAAGPCTVCPKRTGNQPELFGDVQGADVCTDPECFKNKTRVHGEIRIAAAKERGQPVIVGGAAKKLCPHGLSSYRSPAGYFQLTDKPRQDDRNRMAKSIVPKGTERVLFQDPGSGRVVELLKSADVMKALDKKAPAATSHADPYRKAQAKAKVERKFRRALYDKVRPKLELPDMTLLAVRLWREMHHETIKTLAEINGWEPKKLSYGQKDYRGLETEIAKLPAVALRTFLNDCIYVNELIVSPHGSGKPDLLLAAAKAYEIDPTAVRASVQPKKKAKKSAKKKPAPKKAKKAAKRGAAAA